MLLRGQDNYPIDFHSNLWFDSSQLLQERCFAIFVGPGAAFEGDPRYVLRGNLKIAADMRYTFYIDPELEYFYF
jgi:glutamine synthetase